MFETERNTASYVNRNQFDVDTTMMATNNDNVVDHSFFEDFFMNELQQQPDFVEDIMKDLTTHERSQQPAPPYENPPGDSVTNASTNVVINQHPHSHPVAPLQGNISTTNFNNNQQNSNQYFLVSQSQPQTNMLFNPPTLVTPSQTLVSYPQQQQYPPMTEVPQSATPEAIPSSSVTPTNEIIMETNDQLLDDITDEVGADEEGSNVFQFGQLKNVLQLLELPDTNPEQWSGESSIKWLKHISSVSTEPIVLTNMSNRQNWLRLTSQLNNITLKDIIQLYLYDLFDTTTAKNITKQYQHLVESYRQNRQVVTAGNRNSALSNSNEFLWQHILRLLLEEQQKDMITWVEMRKGIFQIVHKDKLARSWGATKSPENNNMTFNNLTRSIRVYYKYDEKGIAVGKMYKSKEVSSKMHYAFNFNHKDIRDYVLTKFPTHSVIEFIRNPWPTTRRSSNNSLTNSVFSPISTSNPSSVQSSTLHFS